MIALTDCDIIIKIVAADLHLFLAKALGASKTDFRVGPATKYSIGSKARRRAWGAEVIDKAVNFAKTLPIITIDVPDERNLLADVGIDAGEVILFSATKHFSDSLIATGDKKALRDLYNAPTCKFIYERNEGRVLCFEQILLALIDIVGYDQVRERIVGSPLMQDGAVLVCFAEGAETSDADARARLENYISKLRSETGNLLRD